jgi:hypothetical protein
MRHRLAEVLGKDGPDSPMDPGLLRFWSRSGALSTHRARPAEAEVVDMAEWVASHLTDGSSP